MEILQNFISLISAKRYAHDSRDLSSFRQLESQLERERRGLAAN